MKSCLVGWLLLGVTLVDCALGDLDFELAWKVESKEGFSGPNEIRDMTTGKTRGIVVCDVGAGIVCFAADGERLWEYALKPPVTAYPAVGDIDGDGTEEVVACGGQGTVVVLDASGKLKWTAHTPGSVGAESCPSIADLDGDGKSEILVGDLTGWLSCFDGTGRLRWAFRGKGEQMGPAVVADIYDTPGKEILVTSHDRHIYALSAQGAWLWDINRDDDLFPNSTPILADVDGDGILELYVGGGLHHFYRIDLRKPALVLEKNVLTHVNSAICATDFDGDGKDEIVFGNKGGGVWCYGHEGFRWNREVTTINLSMCPMAVDLDGDPDLEVLFLFNGIHAFDTDGSSLLEASSPGIANSPPLVGDFDNDGRMEIIIAGHGMFGTSMVACLKWNVPYRRDSRAWTVFAGNRAHTGRVPGAEKCPPLPAILATDAPSRAGFAPHGDVRLFTG
ncbi:MAG: FG-GAP-like repeat-containing protein, partial [Pirellulales bacterium]